MTNKDSWVPVAGDIVRTTLPELKDQYRVKTVQRRKRLVNLFVPCGVDNDGDTVFSESIVPWDKLTFVSGHR